MIRSPTYIAAACSEFIGHTPMLELQMTGFSSSVMIIAKLEQYNPTGSVKDRAAFAMVADAESSGRLTSGSTIIEATSGNTGVALASLGRQRGYRVIIVMPDSISPQKINLIRSYGADIIFTPAVFGMKRAFSEAHRVAAEIPGAFVPDQARNPANPSVHRLTTGQEIIAATDGAVDVFIAGVGTGGTLTGVAQALRARRPDIEIVAVEPSASAVLSGDRAGPHKIEGIGAGFVPDVLDRKVISRVETVSDAQANDAVRHLATSNGLFVGPSSGAVATVAFRLAASGRYLNKTIVTLFPDSGERYPIVSLEQPNQVTANDRSVIGNDILSAGSERSKSRLVS